MSYSTVQKHSGLETSQSSVSEPKLRTLVTVDELKELKMKKKMSKKLSKSSKSHDIPRTMPQYLELPIGGTPLCQGVPTTASNIHKHNNSDRGPRESRGAKHYIHPSQYFPFGYKVPREFRHLLVAIEDMPQQFQATETYESSSQTAHPQLQVYMQESAIYSSQRNPKHVHFEKIPAKTYNHSPISNNNQILPSSSSQSNQQHQVLQKPRSQTHNLKQSLSPPPPYTKVANTKTSESMFSDEDIQIIVKALTLICGLILLVQIFKVFKMIESQFLTYLIYAGIIWYVLMNYVNFR